MKIFMGMVNIASMLGDYAAGFRALGHEVFSVVEVEHSAVTSGEVDLHIPRLVQARLGSSASEEEKETYRRQLKELAWRKALEADLCFFIWQTFREDCSDLAELKQLGKKVVVRICGSDTREPEVEEQAALFEGRPQNTFYLASSPYLLWQRLRYLRMAEAYADVVIGLSRMALRPVFIPGGWLYAPEKMLPHPPQRREPVLLHAPTRWASKGTQEILSALEMLRNAGLRFGVKMLQGIPHEEIMREYASVDVVCNSIFYSGRTIYEAMWAGCAVADYGVAHIDALFSLHAVQTMRLSGFSGNKKDLKEQWYINNDVYRYIDMPIAPIRPDTVLPVLGELIQNHSLREKMATRGREYVRTQLSPERRCKELLDYIETPESEESRMRLLFYPFFNAHFIPQNDHERIWIYNKGTRLVKNCTWYQQFVRPAYRGGLVF